MGTKKKTTVKTRNHVTPGNGKPGGGEPRRLASTVLPADGGARGGKPVHFSEMQRIIGVAEERRQTVNVKAWTSDGRVNDYNGWYVHHQYWRKGFVRLRNPVNRQIRLVPEIFIIEINGCKIYL